MPAFPPSLLSLYPLLSLSIRPPIQSSIRNPVSLRAVVPKGCCLDQQRLNRGRGTDLCFDPGLWVMVMPCQACFSITCIP